MLKQKHNSKKESGIALITTIILMSIMLASVSVVSKEMLDEVKNSTRIDNSLIAYYAAEAGLEDALLELRYDHEAEISKENDANPDSVDVTCTTANPCTPRTVNMSSDQIDYGNKAFNTSYYDVVMWNKSSQILDQKILKDDTAEFVIPNMTQNLILNWDTNPNTPGNSDYRVEITVYDENGNMIPAFPETDSQGRTGGKQFTDPGVTRATIPTSIGSGKKTIRIKPSYVNKNPDSSGAYTKGAPITGDTPSISLSINKNTTTGNLIASTITNIESVGYYGGVARKISATVDRTSGNILSIFDYTIYSGSDLIK